MPCKSSLPDLYCRGMPIANSSRLLGTWQAKMSKGGMPEALRYLFIIYFVTHIPITMLIDGQVWTRLPSGSIQ